MIGYPVEAGANSVLKATEDRGIKTSPMKLQKLLYLMHGYYIALTGKPLVDEEFEAWPYGPVAPTIYHDLKKFGGGTIPSGCRLNRLNVETFEFETPSFPDDDEQAKKVLSFVLSTYGAQTAVYLSDLTHKVGSPWERVKRENPYLRNVSIKNEMIKDYFSALVKPQKSIG
jgi:uncharacterized phage-associated protein